MTELLTFLVGFLVLGATAYVGFLYGRDRAESRAHETVANLRRANMGLRARLDRVEERNARLARALSDAYPLDPKLPEWMRP